MIRLADGIEYVELYYTLRCNFRCPYCINGNISRARYEADYIDIVDGINDIDFRGLPLTIGGGEPTIKNTFYDMVNSLRPDIKIDLLTNGQFSVEEFMRNIPNDRLYNASDPAYKNIRISYHQGSDPQEISTKAQILDLHGYRVGIFGIAHPESLKANMQMAEICRKKGVFFFVKEFLGEYDGQWYGHYKYPRGKAGTPFQVMCRGSEVLIGPGGDIYRCHHDLYLNTRADGNIIDYSGDTIEYEYRPCQNYGECNLCDLKIKISPDFKKSRCSIEVKE